MCAVDWGERLSRVRKDGTVETESTSKQEEVGRSEKGEEKPVIKDRF
jgi:hypothetical protein